MGQMCEWNLKKKIYLGAFFLKIGGNGANVLVEFEKKILTGGIFFLNWGQKIILGSRKSAFLGIILTPAYSRFKTGITDSNPHQTLTLNR